MKKLLDYLLLGIAIAALITAFEWYREHDRVKKAEAYLQAQRNARRETAPERSILLAMQSEKIQLAEDQMSELKGNGLRYERAGAFFLIAYLPAADILPQFCLQNGIDIQSFQRAYQALHREPLERAQRLTSGTPYSEEHLRKQYESNWREGVANYISHLAINEDRTVVDVCRSLESGGAELAAVSNLAPRLPQTYAVLLEAK